MISQLTKSHLEEVKVLEISNANAVTTDFRGVCRSDAFFGSADFVATKTMLTDPVYFLMKVKNQVGSIREQDSVFGVNALML
jgi:hypothetical protein